MSRAFLLASTAIGALASPLQVPRSSSNLPARYNGSLAGATFLFSTEAGGVATPPTQYQDVYIQAQHGHLVFTQKPPTRVCPCSDSFGAQNFTGYYVGGTNEAPTVQLFTSSPHAQYIYVASDLSIRYTLPGAPIPPGANHTSITLFTPEPLGGGLPSSGSADVNGHVTHPNGTRTYYNGVEFCAPEGSPPRTENGVGPLSIRARNTAGRGPDGGGLLGDRCISGSMEFSINDPKVGPYYIAFNTPSEPLASAYA